MQVEKKLPSVNADGLVVVSDEKEGRYLKKSRRAAPRLASPMLPSPSPAVIGIGKLYDIWPIRHRAFIGEDVVAETEVSGGSSRS